MKIFMHVCAVLNVSLLVASERFLFKNGYITYKRIKNDAFSRRDLYFRNVTSIDQHLITNDYVVSIKVQQAEVPYLHEGSVRNLVHLKHLALPVCKIKAISPKAFQNLPQLTALHLQQNEIEIIKNGVFGALNVAELYLQRNQIHTIHPEAFDNMPRLKKIQLNNNKLKRWDGNWFRNVPKLTLLYFRRNFIEEIPARAFANIKTSHKKDDVELVDTIIYLSHNGISSIHPQAFLGIDALNELWLDRNNITEIRREPFSHLVVFNKLYLHRNKITEIHEHAFRSLQKMEKLKLSANDLNCLPYDVISKVEVVIVKRNSIACSCMSNLKDRLQEDGLKTKVKYDTCV